MIRRLFLAALSSLPWSSAFATDWPTKPIKIIVPFPAGGATDLPARLVGERLGKLWQQPVIIENRPGAGGSLAAAEVARSTADGYTLLFPSGSVMTVNQFVYSKLPYDPEKDFTPITIVVSGPSVLVVPEASPFTSIDALIAGVRKSPGKLTFGHAGIGSQSHMANEYFLQQAKLEALGVPYKGDPPAIVDMVGGHLDFAIMSLGASLSVIKSGKLRALGVTSKDAISQLPGVPPIASVLPNFDNSGWFGLVAPANMPPDVARKIAQDVHTVLEDPELHARFETLGFRVVANSPQAMSEAMVAERKRWGKLVKDRGIGQLQ